MPPVLAVCHRCGYAFPSGIVIENSTNIQMVGNQSQCPRCGAMASVPDGRYDAIGDTIRIIAASAKSLESLRRLEAILQGLKQQSDLSGEKVGEAIRSQAPEFSALAPVVEHRGVDVGKWIGVLLMAITVMIMMWDRLDPANTGSTPEQIREITREVIRQTQVQAAPAPTMTSVPLVSPKPPQSRNSLCRCGSGKKYKRCHGRNSTGSAGPLYSHP